MREHLWSYGRQYNYVAVMDYNLPGGPIRTGADGVRRRRRAGRHEGRRRHLPACHERQGHGRLHRHPAAADARRAALARSGPQAGHRRRAGVRHHPHVTSSSAVRRGAQPIVMSSSTGNSARHRALASGSTSTKRTSSSRPGLRHHRALGVDHHGVTTELDAGLRAHLVARDEPGLVLDRAGPREDVPVLDARRRPAGRQQEGRGPALRQRAEELREAQVVAGGQARRPERRLDDEQLVAAAHEDGLAAVEAEQVDLAVARHEAAVGREQHAGVVVAAVLRELAEGAAVQPRRVLGGEPARVRRPAGRRGAAHARARRRRRTPRRATAPAA